MGPNPLKVLAIEDSEDHLTSLEALVHDVLPGCTWLAARSGPQGIALARDAGPDVILVDTMLPELDGFDVVRQLKDDERLRGIPALLISALPVGQESRVRALTVGAAGILAKPIDAQELAAGLLAMAKLSAANRRERQESERLAAELAERAFFFQESQRAARIGSYRLDFASREWVASRVLEEIFGIAPGARRSFGEWESLIHPDDRERMVRYLSHTVVGDRQPFNQEYRIVRRSDGAVRWVHGLGELRVDVAGALESMIGTVQDITERRAADAALRDSEFRWKFAIEGSGNGLWDWDVPTDKVFFSSRWKSVLGFADDEIGDTLEEWKSRVHSDDLPRVMADMAALVEGTASTYRSEHRMRCKDGTWMSVLDRGAVLSRDGTGRALRMIGTIEDQTRQREAEELLRLQGGALEAAANAIVITDAMGMIAWANTAFTTCTGYSVQEAIGRTPGDLLRSGSQDRPFYERMWTTITSGGVWVGEIVNRRKDGSTYTEEMTITPLKDAAGVITHFVAVKQDVTQRKLLEDQFRQAHKMESVGRLAGGIAHDFNNMLGVILGRTELAMLEVDRAQPVHEHLAEIEQAARRSAGLTRQLLAFARKGSITPKELDLNECVTEELKMLRRLIGENIHLEWQPASPLWPVRMDPSQLDQILANLCVNARDAITDTGRLMIATANDVVDERFCATHPSAVPGEYVRLTVSDSGCGMTTDVLSHLFEPFFTTKAVGEGTGLGLATVYGAVKQSNGFITVTSEPGAGTTFEIYLPRHVGAGGRAPESAVTAPMRRGHETILLVEDERMVLRLAARVLEESGYVVLSADGPAKAMRLAAEHDGRIDLLLTDVVMPKMNGRELADMLAKRYPALRRLFMSGFAAAQGGAPGVSDDEAHFIPKPFTVEALTAKVREVLDRAESEPDM